MRVVPLPTLCSGNIARERTKLCQAAQVFFSYDRIPHLGDDMDQTVQEKPKKGAQKRSKSAATNAPSSSALTGKRVVPPASPKSDAEELRSLQILAALMAFEEGDFTDRLPSDWAGTHGRIAETFNRTIGNAKRLTQETLRVSSTVGKEGRLSQRMSVPGTSGGWVEQVDSLILIVDDEPRNLAVMECVLDDPGYQLIRATSGDEALLALMAHEFAVLVLDVRMSDMTGFELAQLVKERRKTARIPIIFLTAYYNEDQHILEGYTSGAVDYLHKPVNPAVLRSKVAIFAELHRNNLALERANAASVGEIAERQRAEAHPSELNSTLEINADPIRLAQAFNNLLHNAAKYTDRGGRIEVGVQALGNTVFVTVRDSGIGIASDRLNTIFEMFSQVETALKRSRGGLGIGLTFTRRLIELHGGAVTAQSLGLGQGSDFLVQLPLADPQPAARADEAPVQKQPDTAVANRPLRIPIADDNVDSADTLACLMEVLGHTVCQVHDGAAAVAKVTEFDPQPVLLDIGMPKLNGYETCRQIRALPGGSQRTVVAITGWGQPGDRQRSQEAGFDRHLVKPLDPAELQQVITTMREHP